MGMGWIEERSEGAIQSLCGEGLEALAKQRDGELVRCLWKGRGSAGLWSVLSRQGSVLLRGAQKGWLGFASIHL